MRKNEQSVAQEKLNRRTFLSATSVGIATAALGIGAWGLMRGLTPSAAVDQHRWSTSVNLNDLPSGEAISVPHNGKPVFVLRMNQTQAAMAREAATVTTPDLLARHPNLHPDATASLENRTFELDDLFAVFDGRCPRLGCVPIFNTGDYGGWFCPCGGAHFDLLGRIRKGPAPTNLLIPNYDVIDDTRLVLLEGRQPISEREMDRILYGDG